MTLSDGLIVTLQLLAISTAAGLAIACVVAFGRLSRARLLRWPATVYAGALRGTPLLVQIYIVYYGLAQAVPAGEREAAVALGLRRFQTFRLVVMPRALRLGLPALVNEVLVQVKATSLASTVTILDLTGVARRMTAASFTTTPLVEAGIIYAALALLIGLGAHLLERGLALPGER